MTRDTSNALNDDGRLYNCWYIHSTGIATAIESSRQLEGTQHRQMWQPDCSINATGMLQCTDVQHHIG